MKVKLDKITEDPINTVSKIASICYGKEEARNPQVLFKKLFSLGHTSVYEHVNMTFKIEGISRSCLQQLVRHRLMSPTVESQRYVDQFDSDVIIPESIRNNKDAYEVVQNVINVSKNSYKTLRDMGITKEDARYILVEGSVTNLYLTMNLRQLVNLTNIRCKKDAQDEIRVLSTLMIREVLDRYPNMDFMFQNIKEELEK